MQQVEIVGEEQPTLDPHTVPTAMASTGGGTKSFPLVVCAAGSTVCPKAGMRGT